MVSGLVTSPFDRSRILSGEANLIAIEAKFRRAVGSCLANIFIIGFMQKNFDSQLVAEAQ
jgi:hypothetical protein